MTTEIDWSQVSAVSAIGGLVVMIGTQFIRLGKLAGIAEKAEATASEAKAAAAKTASDLSEYKTLAVEKFASREQFDMMEQRFTTTVERLGDRIASDMRALGERFDRIRDSHAKMTGS